MTAQPIRRHEPERVPRNAKGIADALTPEAAKEFYAELLAARPEEAKGVLLRWWGRAMLESDPGRHRRVASALTGTMPTIAVQDMLERRRAAGLPVE
ncbi:VOC family protein [Streptomyces sp. TE12347]